MAKKKNRPEGERSNILRFQPPVTKADRAGCTSGKRSPAADPLAQEGLRLFKVFFAIEDVALRASMLTMLENIAIGTRAGRKRDGR